MARIKRADRACQRRLERDEEREILAVYERQGRKLLEDINSKERIAAGQN